MRTALRPDGALLARYYVPRASDEPVLREDRRSRYRADAAPSGLWSRITYWQNARCLGWRLARKGAK